MRRTGDWSATLRIVGRSVSSMDALDGALRPEMVRDAHRATLRLVRLGPRRAELRFTASDTTSMRAALNTHLGWIALVRATRLAVAGSPDLTSR